MRRIELIRRIAEEGIVAVIRAGSEEQGLRVVEAVNNGGIKFIEVTMTVPGALDIIKKLTGIFENEDVFIGAGTVLDPETARYCILSGARYIVSPSFNRDTVILCNRYRIPVMPGVMTIGEALEALEYGVEVLKIFPGSLFGPDIIKSYKGPLPQANFMPTGGVNLSNMKEWFKAGAIAVGIGGELTRGASIGNYELVTETARSFVNEVKQVQDRL